MSWNLSSAVAAAAAAAASSDAASAASDSSAMVAASASGICVEISAAAVMRINKLFHGGRRRFVTEATTVETDEPICRRRRRNFLKP